MTQFHEGQEVEVTQSFDCGVAIYGWRKAKIVCEYPNGVAHLVEFTDGSRRIFREDHIRAATN
jgi:hypothetical protein